MKFKINAQTSIIDTICEAIETSILGISFKNDWEIDRKDNQYGSTLYFTLKEGASLKLDVIFWIGYFSSLN